MSKNTKKPTWGLDDQWAVDTDPYNWILYKRGKKKDGSPGTWSPTGYYATADKLLMGLYQHLTRLEPQGKDLVKHLEACYERVRVLAARLSDELNQDGLGRTTKAPSASKTKHKSRHELSTKANAPTAGTAEAFLVTRNFHNPRKANNGSTKE